MDGSPVERSNDTLEEREARLMASTTALRRDFAPIVRVRVVQEMGAIRLQVLESLEESREEFSIDMRRLV